MSNIDDLRFPIGKFTPQASYSRQDVSVNISRIESIPSKIESAIKTISTKQLDTPYREGGWTIRQVLHHLPDSHMNAYIRFKWTLTEETPTIKAYNEKAWAETPEITTEPAHAIALLKALHMKWVDLLSRLSDEDLKKEFIHPDTNKRRSLAELIALYAWHGEHHLGHINIVMQKS